MDRLKGKTETIPSSDEAIINNLKIWTREYRGILQPEVILESKTLVLHSSIVGSSQVDDIKSLDQDKKIVDISRLKHSDSALGKHLWETRPQNKKGAA